MMHHQSVLVSSYPDLTVAVYRQKYATFGVLGHFSSQIRCEGEPRTNALLG